MKISRFRAVNLHGYLSFTLNFRPELTFLTGINGSGKTSAVRAMTALLSPSIYLLANMAYSSVSVTVMHEGVSLEITSHRSSEDISLEITGVQEKLRMPVFKPEAYEPRHRFNERQREFYREQEAINVRHPVLVAIEKLPTPMFLDLERRHQDGTRIRREESRFIHRAAPINPLAGSLIESINEAQELGEQTYRRFLADKTFLTDELKKEVILAAFKPVDEEETSGPWKPKPDFLEKVRKNEILVNQSLSQLGISSSNIEETVKPFFRLVREVAKRLPTEKEFDQSVRKSKSFDQDFFKPMQEWSALIPKIQQVNHLAERIATYNSQLSKAFASVERYLTSVNSFLADSKKQLAFDDSGNLHVSLGETLDERPISALSSGERQLVVILTHLAFNRQAKRANILIIDEPELSLHLRWQELFVDAVTSASPGLQVILATHSPAIIKGRINDCIDVEEARQNDRLLG